MILPVLTIFILSVVAYFLIGSILTRAMQRKTPPVNDSDPFVSVIIAAKDEADNLYPCLQSVLEQEYPQEKLEILVVNDDSGDGTERILQSFNRHHANFRYINLDASSKLLPGKAGAILPAIEQAKGEIICLTDADCRVAPGWIKGLVRHFDEKTGLVGGFTLLDSGKKRSSLFGKVQSLDWLFLLGIACGSSLMGKPLSWVGNNLAFRKKAYDEIGGFKHFENSLIEDFSLINAIANKTHWQIKFLAEPDTLVRSLPLSSLRRLYNQRKRWATGIKNMSFFGKLVMVTSFVAHLWLLPVLFVLPPIFAVIGLFVLFLTDFNLVLTAAKKVNRIDLLAYFIGFELFYLSYSILLPFLILFDQKIEWKNRVYNKNS